MTIYKGRRTIVRRSKKLEEDQTDSHKAVTVNFPAKYYGKLEVSEPRGDAVCETALALLKTRLKVAKAHKKRVILIVGSTDIHVLERHGAVPLHVHLVLDIAFVWVDPCDARSCGVIVRRTDYDHPIHEFFAYKLEQSPHQLVGVLKHVIYRMDQEQDSGVSPEMRGNEMKADFTSKPSSGKEIMSQNLISLDDVEDNMRHGNSGLNSLVIHSNFSNLPSDLEGRREPDMTKKFNWDTFDEDDGRKKTSPVGVAPPSVLCPNPWAMSEQNMVNRASVPQISWDMQLFPSDIQGPPVFPTFSTSSSKQTTLSMNTQVAFNQSTANPWLVSTASPLNRQMIAGPNGIQNWGHPSTSAFPIFSSNPFLVTQPVTNQTNPFAAHLEVSGSMMDQGSGARANAVAGFSPFTRIGT
ncbi:unnamed protein product [Calicophoron daubneyi]|uniref:PID domain-containing protein n=1 Tax=Calicophoron daubneyi TaxID=300641 RepID=A0AAV2TX31_CALDB